jgi:hypothetical protein
VRHDEELPHFVVVPVGDSPESRLFIELSSIGADLAEARHAIDLAARSLEESSALDEARQHLVGLAVIAYCRTVLHSSVRRRLTDFVAVPDGLANVHDQVRAYSNATVAHSQSELSVTYAVGIIDSETLEVRDVAGPTVLMPLPDRLVLQFRDLIDAMENRLHEVLEPVRATLINTLTEMDADQLLASAGPEIQARWAHEFNAKSKRARYPTGHAVYWNRVGEAPHH